MFKRIIGFSAGLIYGIFLWFIFLMLTGGGHGNVTWLVYFAATSLGGSFYPVLGFLIVDLKRGRHKILLASVLLLHFILIFIVIFEGIIPPNSSTNDFTWRTHPFWLTTAALLLTLPPIAGITRLVRSLS